MIDGRNSANGFRRRRECKKCGTRFSTYEFTLGESLTSNVAMRSGEFEKDRERKDAAMRILARVDAFARELSDAVGKIGVDNDES